MVSKASYVKNGERALAVAERCWRCEVRSVQHSLGLCWVGREEKAGEMVGAGERWCAASHLQACHAAAGQSGTLSFPLCVQCHPDIWVAFLLPFFSPQLLLLDLAGGWRLFMDALTQSLVIDHALNLFIVLHQFS